MRHYYHLETDLYGKVAKFKTGQLNYLAGWMDAMRGRGPTSEIRLVRSDGKIVDTIEANDKVDIGMIAGFPTVEQYERAYNDAIMRAKLIRAREMSSENSKRGNL